MAATKSSSTPFLIRRLDALRKMEANKAFIDNARVGKVTNDDEKTSRITIDDWVRNNLDKVAQHISSKPEQMALSTSYNYGYFGRRNVRPILEITIYPDELPDFPDSIKKPEVVDASAKKQELQHFIQNMDRQESGVRGVNIGSKYERMCQMIDLLKISDEQYIDAKFYDEIQVFVADYPSRFNTTN